MLQLEPYGPIGIIAHNANREFVKAVSDVLSQKRKKRFDTNASPYVNTPGYYRTDYLIDTDLIRFVKFSFFIWKTKRNIYTYIYISPGYFFCKFC